jgi:peptidoglycan/LPS O-acetylase OafA/YrhL
MTTPVNNRNLSIDIFRAVAIIIITSYHVSLFLHNPAKPYFIFDLYAPFQKGIVGVAIFVFISGYITHTSSSHLPWQTFIKKRLLRICFPYYIAVMIMNLLLFTRVLTAECPTVFDNITHLLFVHNLFPKTFFSVSGQFWYIALQMQLYLVYLLIRSYVKKNGLYLLAASFVFLLITNVLIPCRFSDYAVWEGVISKSIFSYGFLFILGMVIKDHEDLCLDFLRKSYIFYPLLIAVIGWMFLKNDLIGYGELDCMGIGLLFGLIMLGMPKVNPDHFIARPLLIIGTASYSIFLYNFLFWTFAPQLYFIRGLAVYSFITISIGITMYYLIEEPIVRMIKKF